MTEVPEHLLKRAAAARGIEEVPAGKAQEIWDKIREHQRTFTDLQEFTPMIIKLAKRNAARDHRGRGANAESGIIGWQATNTLKGIPVDLFTPSYGHNDSRTDYGTVYVTFQDIYDELSTPELTLDTDGTVRDENGKVLGRVVVKL